MFNHFTRLLDLCKETQGLYLSVYIGIKNSYLQEIFIKFDTVYSKVTCFPMKYDDERSKMKSLPVDDTN